MWTRDASTPGLRMPFVAADARLFEKWSDLPLFPSIRFRGSFHGRPAPRVARQSFDQPFRTTERATEAS